jgi:hypothetical protein
MVIEQRPPRWLVLAVAAAVGAGIVVAAQVYRALSGG